MQRLDNLQGLRAIAFLVIFLSHCGIFISARWSVTLFFVLSGFLMVYNYFHRNHTDCSIKNNIVFSYKKINKLYPFHLVMLLPVLALTLYRALKSGTLNFDFAINQGLILLSNVSLVQSWIPIRDFYFGYNGVAWFLSVCAFLYFLFPFVLRKLKGNWSRKKAALIIAGSFLFQLAFSVFVSVVNCEWINAHKEYLVYIFPLYRAFDFIIGCNLGYLFLHSESKNNSSGLIKYTAFELITVLISVALPVMLGLIDSGDVLFSVKDMFGVVSLIYVFGFNKGLLSKLLSTKPFVFLGNLSAYTFLIHQVVINYVQIVFANKFIVAVLALALTCIIAIVFNKLISKSAKNNKRMIRIDKP